MYLFYFQVTSLARHPGGRIFASGQRYTGGGGQPAVICWDESRLDDQLRGPRVITSLSLGPEAGTGQGRVYEVTFCREGRSVAAVGGGEGGSWITVWEWKTGTRMAGGISHALPTLAVEFEPWAGGGLVACGVGHIRFFEYAEADSFRARRGKHAGRSPCSSFMSLGFVRTWCDRGGGGKEEEWRLLTGSQEGEILAWKDRTVLYRVKSHDGPVWDISVLSVDGRDMFATGGADGQVGMWRMQWATESAKVGVSSPFYMYIYIYILECALQTFGARAVGDSEHNKVREC